LLVWRVGPQFWQHQSEHIDFDPLEGLIVSVERFPVEAGHIMMFARSIGDPNQCYYDDGNAESGGVIAPPTFVQASAQFDPDYPLRPQIGKVWFGSGSTPSGLTKPAPDANEDEVDELPGDRKGGEKKSSGAAAGGLHAEQHYTYHRHPKPGDVLTATSYPGKTWEKHSKRAGKLMFSESITEYRDQGGELVVTARGVGVRTEKVIEN